MPRQSARSKCPIMIVPKHRRWTKVEWKFMWRMCRILWRDNHEKWDQAFSDAVIYGTGYFRPNISGLS